MRKPKYKKPDEWVKPGVKVYYHKLINPRGPHDGVEREILNEPWQLGHGQWVVKIDGISGGVCLEAITQAQQ